MDFQPQDKFYVKDVETLKVFADQRRIQILQLVGERGYTIKDLSVALGLASAQLYYHIKLMEEHGLICVVDTQISATQVVEKTYRATAKRYVIDEDLRPIESAETILGVAFSAIDSTKEEIRQNASLLINQESDDRRAEFAKGKLFLTPEQAREVARSLNAIWESYADEDQDMTGKAPYTLLVVFFESPENPKPENADRESQ